MVSEIVQKGRITAQLVKKKDWKGIYSRLIANISKGQSSGNAAEFWNKCHAHSEDNFNGIFWWETPGMQLRRNRLISGSSEVTYHEYIAENFLKPRKPLNALTLGCGTGHNERTLARYYQFTQHDAVDISTSSLKIASENAKKEGFMHLRYFEADLNLYELSPKTYDVIFAEASLHHIENLEHVLSQVRKGLRTGGIFVLNEYVGPSRFQWTPRQLEAMNGALTILPPRLRIMRTDVGQIKTKIERPSIKHMLAADPSEAVRSEEIPRLVKKSFKPIEWRGYGGSLLHILLENIAGNFNPHIQEDMDWLEYLFRLEDMLIATGELGHDFVVAICE